MSAHLLDNCQLSCTIPACHLLDNCQLHLDGAGRPQREALGAGSGALTVCQCCTTCTAAHTRGCSCTPSSSSATLWGKGASVEDGGCTLTRRNQSGPNSQSSAPASWDSPGPVVWGQPLSTGEPLALACPSEVTVASMPWEGVALPSSAAALPQSLWAHRLHRDRSTQGHPYKPEQVTFIT